MSRTYKDRKGYKTKRLMNFTNSSRHRGSYEDYDHSDQELYVYDQCCENCRYFYIGCSTTEKYGCRSHPESNWCEDWKGYGGVN